MRRAGPSVEPSARLFAQVVRRERDHEQHGDDHCHEERDAAEDDERGARALPHLSLVLELLHLLREVMDDLGRRIGHTASLSGSGSSESPGTLSAVTGTASTVFDMTDDTFTRRTTLA